MNPKLIIASIAGIGTLGGGVALCYYSFRREINTKKKVSSKPEVSPSNEQTTLQNRESVSNVVPEDSSKLTTAPQQDGLPKSG